LKKALSPEQLRRYEEDGILFPVPAISREEALASRSAFERLESQFGGPLKYAAMTHLYFRWACELAMRPAILDAVENILGRDLIIASTLILCKYPRDPAYASWHQDHNYGSSMASTSVSAWVALSESDSESGCLRVIPGSHRRGALPHTETVARNNLFNLGQVLEVDEALALNVSLRPGEMSLHQGDLIHGSAPNSSETKRIGFIVRFVTPAYKGTGDVAVRARGRAACAHLTLASEPPESEGPENFSAWKNSL
jgi:non-heme Fe2+,alpha-ketoglutarate-dependent halogenase